MESMYPEHCNHWNYVCDLFEVIVIYVCNDNDDNNNMSDNDSDNLSYLFTMLVIPH